MRGIENERFLEILAKSEAGSSKNRNSPKLANKFETLVRESQAFSWMGVISNEEESQHAVDVYLIQRANAPEGTRNAAADVLDSFDSLALALEPEIIASLHLMDERECSAEDLSRALDDPTRGRSLKWQRYL